MNELMNQTVIEQARQRFGAHMAARERIMIEAVASGDTTAMNQLDELPRYVSRFVQMGRPELAAELLGEVAGGQDARAAVLERVIEQNELMAASFFARGLAASRAVGRIVLSNAASQTRGYGTGFMISPRLMMTNNHVLANEAVAARSIIEFDYARGVDGQPMQVKRFALDPAAFWQTSGPLDFSIVAVGPVSAEGAQVESRGWIHLIAESGKAIAGEPINIIQHPGGERQQVAMRENRVIGPEGDFLIYTTDTKQGSSGAPAMNDQWQLAALHHAGVPDQDDDGNWLRMDGGVFRTGIDDPATIRWIGNEGVRISRIVSDMRSRQMDTERSALFEQAFSPAPMADELALPQGASVGPDGVARWNLQLSLGPVTQGATPPPRAPAPMQESVFAPRGPYFDDATEAPLIDAYYAGIDADLSKADLFDALQQLVERTHHTVLSYARARHEHLYPWIDRHEDTALKSIYSGAPMAEELFVAELQVYEAALMREAQIVAGALTNEMIDNVDLVLENSSVFNCEHVVPQSWFKGAAEWRAQKADLHHLFACDSGCNSFRSNIPYSEFSPEEEDRLRAAELSLAEALVDPMLEAARPSCGLRDDRRFEPEAGKGAVARATLYFVLRYPGVVGDIKTGRKKEFVKSNIGLLLEWAETDPPGRYEQHRNAEIAKIQGNRNPLIDHPGWLRKIAFERGFA